MPSAVPARSLLILSTPSLLTTVTLAWFPDYMRTVANSRTAGSLPPLGLLSVKIPVREHPEAAAATKNFGFLNISVPREDDLAACAEHLDQLAIPHTPVINGATGRLIGFHDPDRHELSFYASSGTGARSDALRRVRDVRAEQPSR